MATPLGADPRLSPVVQPVLLDVQTLGDSCRGLSHFRRRYEDGVDIDCRPSGVVGEGHGCPADHEHLAPDSDGTKLLVKQS